MDTRNPPDIAVVKAAERILYREKWRICEERAAQRLAQSSSLSFNAPFPKQLSHLRGCCRWSRSGTGEGQRQPMDRHQDGPVGPGRRQRHPPRRRMGAGHRGPDMVIRTIVLAKQPAADGHWHRPTRTS